MTTDAQIIAVNAQPTPLDYVVAGAQEIVPKAIYSRFDGSGAGSDFLPVLQIISDSGHIVASCPAAKVTAGASADVTWFPRVGGAAAASDGIRYDFDNEGDWLDITATGSDGSGAGVAITTTDPAGGAVFVTASGQITIQAQDSIGIITPSPIAIQATAAGSDINIEQFGGGGRIALIGDAVHTTDLLLGFGTDHLAFFGRTPVSIQPAPTTLAQVIALLHTYGLST